MALKLLKVSINFEIKGDPEDIEDLEDRVYDYLEESMENLDLKFDIEDESEEADSED